jgi:short-subunit dehydrogenase involved in D-alanine esterification of teichoic acids
MSAASAPAHHDGKVVVITSGSDGIGLAIARSMAATGHEVVVCGRDEQRLTAAQDAVLGLHAIRCDVTEQSDVTAFLTAVERRFGRLDVLVNNAGMRLNYLWSDEPAIWRRVEDEVALNLTALINVIRGPLPASESSNSFHLSLTRSPSPVRADCSDSL